MLPSASAYGRPGDLSSAAAAARDTWDKVLLMKCAFQRNLLDVELQNFWRMEMYDLDDVAALMKSVMEDCDGHQVVLRSEHPVACMHHEIDGWLNQRLSATGTSCPSAGVGHGLVQGCSSVRSASGRLFDEPDAVQVRRRSVLECAAAEGNIICRIQSRGWLTTPRLFQSGCSAACRCRANCLNPQTYRPCSLLPHCAGACAAAGCVICFA